MNDQQWFNRVGLLAVGLVVLAGGFALYAQAHAGPGAVAASTSGAPSTTATEYLYLTIAFNPATGMDEYFPANFTVPANTPVVVVITNYDNGTNIISANYGAVAGTVGGSATAYLNGSAQGQSYSSWSVLDVAHTFTISQGGEQLNVPIPPAGPTGLPTTVSFTTEFNTSGSFTWECMAPCDDGSMATLGLMAGTVDVA